MYMIICVTIKQGTGNLPSVSFPNNRVYGITGNRAVGDKGVSGDDRAFLHGAHVG